MKNAKLCSVLFYLGAVVFDIAAIVSFITQKTGSMGIVFLCLGSSFLCFGSMYRSKGEKDENKKLLRQKYISIRKAVADKPQKSMEIARKLFADEWYLGADTVAVYKSLSSEVDTSAIIEQALKDGKRVALPKVFGSEMRFFSIAPKEVLIKSSFGVFEPLGESAKYVSPDKISLVIVPGLCFDKEKNRLGFGRGYYDRFLCTTGAKTVALCFAQQIAGKNVIPTDKYDVKMQKIITESEIY